jgi:hypothetical protein
MLLPFGSPAALRISGGFEDQPRDFLRVRDQREMGWPSVHLNEQYPFMDDKGK